PALRGDRFHRSPGGRRMTDDRRRSGSTPNRSGGKGYGPIPTFDLYGVLAARPDATHQELVEAVAAMDRRLQTAAARQRGGATARQKRLNVARYWLLDADRRRTYDAAVARGAAGAGAGTGKVSSGRVRGGSAARQSAGGWWRNPLTWAGAAIVVAVVG